MVAGADQAQKLIGLHRFFVAADHLKNLAAQRRQFFAQRGAARLGFLEKLAGIVLMAVFFVHGRVY